MRRRLSVDVPEREIDSGSDGLLSFWNPVLPETLCRTTHHQQTAIEQRYVYSRNVLPGQMPHLENPGRAEAHARDDRTLAKFRFIILVPGDAVRSGSIKIQKHAVVFGAAGRFDPSLDH